MSLQKAFVGDVGRILTLTSADDLSDVGITKTVIIEKPDGTNPATAITPTFDATGKIASAVTRSGDLDQVGTYKIFLRAVVSGVVDLIVATDVLEVERNPR